MTLEEMETGTEARPVRVAIVNDYEIVVHGLAALLSPYADRIEVVEVETGGAPTRPADIVLYDAFAMQGVRTPAIVELVETPEVGCVVLYTWNITPAVHAAARNRKVRRVLSKALSADELAAALEDVHRGEQGDEPDGAEGPAPTSPSPERVGAAVWPGRDEGLTPRESEVVALIVQGLANEEVAARMYLSINSVKSYIRTAYRTMGVTSRSQAILWGIDHGMRTRWDA